MATFTMALYFHFLLLAISWLASGQQFMGDVIPNTLPTVPGSELAYWRTTDKKNRQFTLTNYFSQDGHGNRLTTSNVKRAVVVIHGLNRDPQTYMSNMLSALSRVPSGSGPTTANTQIIAPYFPNGDDKNIGYPWNSSAPAGGYGSTSNALVWKASGWASGENNQYPRLQIATSSYDVLDAIIKYFANRDMYPNLNQIVIAGHSLGAQMTQRYAAVGNQLSLPSSLRLTYWIGNPNSFVWLDSSRPLDTSTCPGYDDWRDGLSNYDQTYGSSLVASGAGAVLANYNSRSIAYARGLQDFGDDSSDCSPFTTGQNRGERFFNFIKAFPPTCAGPSDSACDTIDYVVSGHDAGVMFSSTAGQTRLFLDNFNGDLSRATDFYCPRQAVGDNPLPGPECSENSTSSSPSASYSGMTYAGCWSDQDPASLPYMIYDTSDNTIEKCTSTCAQLGYSIAGMEFGSQCFCGNKLTAKAARTVDNACFTPCAGNSSETCGSSRRLSVFSKGTPTVLSDPTVPYVVGNFIYQGCWMDNNPSRALNLNAFASETMTIEACADFCSSYGYFGLEYSRECYCGNSISAGNINMTESDCAMTCSGNDEQLCGGPNRLTFYARNGTIPESEPSPSTDPLPVIGVPAPSTSAITCPSADQTIFDAINGGHYIVECGVDHAAGDLASTSAETFDECINTCDSTAGCVDVSYLGVGCYMKSTVGLAVSNGVWTARLIGRGNETSSAPDPKTTTTSAKISETKPATSGGGSSSTDPDPICPGSNNQIYTMSSGKRYQIECGVDHAGGDMPAPNGQQANSLAACIAICDTRDGCVDVSLSGVACYLKSSVGASMSNPVMGARLLISEPSVATSSWAVSNGTQSTSAASPVATVPTPPADAATTTTTTTTATRVSAASYVPPLPSGFEYLGCYEDGSTRTLDVLIYVGSSTTPSKCALDCRGQGYVYSGTEYGQECWCSNTAPSPNILTSSTDCNMPCAGDNSLLCGAGYRLTISHDLVFGTVDSHDPWGLLGCYIDDTASRTLPTMIPMGGQNEMTINNCLDRCLASGNTYCGVEYHGECYGGTTQPGNSLLATPSNNILAAGCNLPCYGNSTQACGGANRILVFEQQFAQQFAPQGNWTKAAMRRRRGS